MWPLHRAVPIARPVAQVVYAYGEQAGVLAALHHAVREWSREELGEDRQHMENHWRFKSFKPSGNSTAMRLAAGSIDTQMERANGTSRLPSTTNRPLPPPSSHPVTRPMDSDRKSVG